MAFTASEKNKICRILRILRIDLQNHLDLYTSEIDASIETDVRAELDKWDTAGAKFVEVFPNTENMGARINPEKQKADIRSNIAFLLGLPSYAQSGSKLIRA